MKREQCFSRINSDGRCDFSIGTQLEVVQTQICRTQDEVLATGEQWKAAMAEKGWD